MSIVRNTLAVAAASALLTLTAACGGADKAVVCAEATRDINVRNTLHPDNREDFNKANADLAAKLKDIAAKADGDLQSALTKAADTWAEIKPDPKNPNVYSAVDEAQWKKVDQATQDVAIACA